MLYRQHSLRKSGVSSLILIDTHILIWTAFESRRLSVAARTAIYNSRQDAQGLAISDMTLLELARLDWQKRISLNVSLESFLQEAEERFVVLPMDGRIGVQAFALPAAFPKDPADRVIVATALVHNLPLITADRAIRRLKACTTIW